MIQSNKLPFSFIRFSIFISFLLIAPIFINCNSQSSKNSYKTVDARQKVLPDSLNFIAHIIETNNDGSKAEIDTVTGYRNYYFPNGKMQMEGKVVKAYPSDYRDGIWKYYNEHGLLMKQETYTKEGKINELDFIYFKNGKPLSKTYQYYEGDYKDKSTFRFHKIETVFDTAGKKLSERHWINDKLISEE